MSTLEIRLQQAGVSDEVIQKTLERLTPIAEGFHSGTATTVCSLVTEKFVATATSAMRFREQRLA
jgi:hypothetical protein